ncbi:unnamed protein product [Mytilus edulis]|uniref:RanBP2-type domain-containing protein n=1 Tax=Mytilus edulis TaxID=6550 RepID=A0A8S3TFY1_MYTED|nr:unnamed protein product [Mytilus edulis]
MWVCLNCHEFNSPENENCLACHTARPQSRTGSSKGRKENKAASLFLEGIKKSVDNTSVVRTRRPASEGTFEQRQQNEDVKKVAEHLVEKFKHLLSSAPNEQIFTGHDSDMSQMTSHMLVAAVDFGTTYSGYAFSFRHEFKDDPLKIHANQAWNAGDSKMKLHNNKYITNEMVLKDISGKQVLALDGTNVEMKDILWVLTVPAIWSDAAKRFMRNSAEKAGIPENNLKIALEPEAASIHSQYLPTKKLIGAEKQGFTMTEPGTKYMVVDLGGGTADITVHKKLSNGGLEELKHATGNDCGGTSVDGHFFQILTQIVGGPLIKIFQEEDPEGYLDIFREFEVVKRTIHPSKTGKVNFSIPFVSLNEKCKTHLGETLSEVLLSSPFKDSISFRGDKMRIDVELMKNIFKPSIDNITSLIQSILDSDVLIDVSQILLVGGFSECLLIQDAIKTKFPNKKIIVPEEAGLSVLKGAVLFGHRPFYIESRKMKYTYGIELKDHFDSSEHDIKRLVVVDGVEYCDKIFEKLVTINETVPVGSIINRSYSATGTTTETDEHSLYQQTRIRNIH